MSPSFVTGTGAVSSPSFVPGTGAASSLVRAGGAVSAGLVSRAGAGPPSASTPLCSLIESHRSPRPLSLMALHRSGRRDGSGYAVATCTFFGCSGTRLSSPPRKRQEPSPSSSWSESRPTRPSRWSSSPPPRPARVSREPSLPPARVSREPSPPPARVSREPCSPSRVPLGRAPGFATPSGTSPLVFGPLVTSGPAEAEVSRSCGTYAEWPSSSRRASRSCSMRARAALSPEDSASSKRSNQFFRSPGVMRTRSPLPTPVLARSLFQASIHWSRRASVTASFQSEPAFERAPGSPEAAAFAHWSESCFASSPGTPWSRAYLSMPSARLAIQSGLPGTGPRSASSSSSRRLP
ncbi:hypothetical protein EES39_24665 [Streptomyces sp. ADI92-24]|nr:hypothetical protein EES39_24665 [Streptomyces sp. ADI92-24]